MLKKILFLILFSAAYAGGVLYAQSNKFTHSLNATAGTLLILNQVGLYYELLQERSSFHTFIQTGLSLGNNSYTEESFAAPFARLGFLAGANPHYLEASAGLVLHGMPLSATLGYRNLDWNDGKIIRFGIGFPDCIYASYGWRL